MNEGESIYSPVYKLFYSTFEIGQGIKVMLSFMIQLTSQNIKMNKKLSAILLFAAGLLITPWANAIDITRVEPANWWIGMKNSELQIMVYGPGISKSTLTINYPGIKLKEVAKTTSPNYLFIYFSIAKGTKPGNVPMYFTEGQQKFTYNYPLLARNDKSGALGFNASDVLYLIMPDRFAMPIQPTTISTK